MYGYVLELKKPMDSKQMGKNSIKRVVVCAENDTQARLLASRLDQETDSQWNDRGLTKCDRLDERKTAEVVAIEKY